MNRMNQCYNTPGITECSKPNANSSFERAHLALPHPCSWGRPMSHQARGHLKGTLLERARARAIAKNTAEADLRAGYARRGDHLRRLLGTVEERNATIAQAAAVSYLYNLLRAPFRDEWRGLLGLAARRSHADKRIPSAPRSSSLGPHSGQHAAVLRPEDFPLRSLPVLSSAAGEMYLLPPRSTTIPSSPQRPARCISCRRGARRSRPFLSGRRDVSLAAAEHGDRPQGHPSTPHPRLHLLLSRSLRPGQ